MAPPLPSLSPNRTALPSHQVTEDTPADYLEGCMEILVVFPNEKSIPMSIQRRMPMLDLLIHVTAANKISPSSHVLQVCDENRRFLAHMPSTPIGSLNAHTVYIVAKNRLSNDRFNPSGMRFGNKSGALQPFEPTFRVQVHLPRNQLFVTRVTPRTPLKDLLHTICNEKNLDPAHYELRHPVNSDERLRLSSCLDDYKLQDVVVVAAGKSQNPVLSVDDLPAMKKSMDMSKSKSVLRATASETGLHAAEKKKRGIFGKFFGKKKGSSMGDSSISSDSAGDRSISPSRSDDSPAVAVVVPASPTPPSPVLFSKRLAEEAVAKRNSRLLSQMPPQPVATPSPLLNGARNPKSNKKRPAPPPPGSVTNGPKAAPEVSANPSSSHNMEGSPKEHASYRKSDSTAAAAEKPIRSRSPRLSSPDSESALSHHPPNAGMNSGRSQSTSNLFSSPSASSSNLTQVSSSSNASLASVIRKRKAPGPPPVEEHDAETGGPSKAASASRRDRARAQDRDRESVTSDTSATSSDVMPRRVETVVVNASANVGKSRADNGEQEMLRSSSSSPDAAALAGLTIADHPASSSSDEDDDYEVLSCRKEADQSFHQADVREEEIKSEPLYSMVVKSPKILRAAEPGSAAGEQSAPTTSETAQQEEETESEVDQDGYVEQDSTVSESPVMWEYKLPAPPTPFKDNGNSLTLTADSSETETCATADSLEEVDEPEEEAPRSRAVEFNSPQDSFETESSKTYEAAPESPPPSPSPPAEAVNPEPEEEAKITLEGADLLGETPTDDLESLQDCRPLEEMEDLPPLPPAFSPPLSPPLSPPPHEFSDGEEGRDSPSSSSELRFSISTYHRRVKKEISYDKKLSRSDSSSAASPSPPPPLPAKPDVISPKPSTPMPKSEAFVFRQSPVHQQSIPENPENEADADDAPLSTGNISETKQEPEAAGSDLLKAPASGSGASVAPVANVPATTLPLNVDLIQQFQNALHTISDPQARALQEEFLRLQQQFLTWQLQQSAGTVGVESIPSTADAKEGSVESASPLTGGTSDSTLNSPVRQKSPTNPVESVVSPKDSRAESPFKELEGIDDSASASESPSLRHGPPRVKLEPWKPGRPRSEVMDHSRASSFNIPEQAPKPPPATICDVIDNLFEEVERISPTPGELGGKSEADGSVAVEARATRPVDAAKAVEVVEPTIAALVDDGLAKKVDHKDVAPVAPEPVSTPSMIPPVMRKSSFLTARPFEARPVPLPIKRPNFAPMVIHPVPSVTRKIIRAPEVRGFASLPQSQAPESYATGQSLPSALSPVKDVKAPRPTGPASGMKESDTALIRNQLIQSARRPSAELNGSIEFSAHSSSHDDTPFSETRSNAEARRLVARPFSMPVSSSLLLAASAAASVKNEPIEMANKTIPSPPISPIEPAVQSNGGGGGGGSGGGSLPRQSLSSRFVRKPDPREELLSSIRDFANGGSLKRAEKH